MVDGLMVTSRRQKKKKIIFIWSLVYLTTWIDFNPPLINSCCFYLVDTEVCSTACVMALIVDSVCGIRAHACSLCGCPQCQIW